MQGSRKFLGGVGVSLLLAAGAAAQQVGGSLLTDLTTYAATPAVTGYEHPLADKIASQLAAFHPQRDNLGNVLVTVGVGAPQRLIAAPLDQPGYVVSGITPDGYLRLQSLPTRLRLPLYNELRTAEPVEVGTANGAWIHGVIAGLSVHLQPGRINGPDPNDLDNLYVDVGARTPAEVHAAGVDVLSPVALNRALRQMAGGRLAAPAIGDDFGAAVLVEALRHLDAAKLTGAVRFAFVTQQWAGERGLARAVAETPGAAVTYVGRADRPLRTKVADHWSVTVSWPFTPAEFVEGTEVAQLATRLETSLGQSPVPVTLPEAAALPDPPLPPRPVKAPTPEQILQALVPLYGVNPHEAAVTQAIERLLPPWAHPTVDEAGNLNLHWGDASARAPRLLFVAHQDEIGFDVASIAPDGRLVLRSRGGGDLDYYAGHPILVHSAKGMWPGVTELPEGWQDRGFKLAGRITVRADVGARSAAEAAALGIQVGDSVTIPKQYRKLLGARATARAFDDRVGDAALIAAAWQLGPSLPGRDVTLAWTVGEEIGLVGAKAMAERLNTAGRTPTYVFAVDTFVSSDSPLESHR